MFTWITSGAAADMILFFKVELSERTYQCFLRHEIQAELTVSSSCLLDWGFRLWNG